MTDEHNQSAVAEKTKTSILWGSFLFLSLLLACGALGGSFYLWHLLQTSQQQVVQQQQQLSHISQQLKETDETIDQQQDKFLEQQRVLARLSALTNQRDQTVLLAEVEYLVRLANFSLHFERNIPQAILLLQTANQRLQSINETSFIKLRSVLTQQITQLQAISSPDIVGLLLKLNALSSEVDKMPLLVAKVVTNGEATGETHPATSETDQASMWRRGWDKTWGVLKSIVVIKHEDAPVVAPPAPVIDRSYLDQHLQLLMANAQWGLIRQQQTLYTNSVKQAIEWVTQYYDPNQQPTKALMDSLNGMVAINIDPTVPDVSSSLELIKQLLAQPVSVSEASTNETGSAS
jgi:uroporphyrin-3 C-methyltransferase